MREIEFRAWVYATSSGANPNQMRYEDPETIFKWKNNGEGIHIMQYTGLKDKNGTKIFEGDVVKWGHVKGGEESPIRVARVDLFPSLHFTIVQNRKNFIKHTFEFGAFMYQNTEKYLEVIGNIHDNPELLKGE